MDELDEEEQDKAQQDYKMKVKTELCKFWTRG